MAGALLVFCRPADARADESVSEDVIVITQEYSLGGFSSYLNSYYEYALSSDEAISTVSLLADTVSISGNVAIANVNEMLNVRKGPSVDYELVGYLPKNAYCYILEEHEDGWVKIQSDNVVGYVKREYLFTDQEAISKAQELGKVMATVEAYSMNLRSEPTTQNDDNVIATLSQGEQYEVLEENILSRDEDAPLWVKVRYNGQEGYVCKTLVELSYELEGAKALTPTPTPTPTPAAEPEKKPVSEASPTPTPKPVNSNADTSELRKQIIAMAETALGVPYVWAGNSLTTGADCSGFCLAVYRACGVDTSGFRRASYDIAVSSAGRDIKRSELKPGDFVFYGKNGRINHVALYYGDGKIIHESSYDGKCVISSLDYSTPMKYRNFLGD